MPAIADEFPNIPLYTDYAKALYDLRPEAVSINTWPDTHAAYAMMALDADCHVFIEKPLAETVFEAEEIAALARRKHRKLLIGYILRIHPSWTRFVEIGRSLGKPLVMRMSLNQQSSGAQWQVHKHLMNSMSPIVDCGVHYVDIMCQVTGAKPVRVHAIGARLTAEVHERMYNYGHLHVVFDDGSVGWYEAGWGPMISETAFFVKDMIGPKGCVSIITNDHKTVPADSPGQPVSTALRLHHGMLQPDGTFATPDEVIGMEDEPDHQELCNREQILFRDAITMNLDLSNHVADAIESLRIVLAADESFRTGEVVKL
jgi:predicted dehydrogenase